MKETYAKPALVIFTFTIWQAVVLSNDVPHIVNAHINQRAAPLFQTVILTSKQLMIMK